MKNNETILVTGVSGNLSRKVVEYLLTKGHDKIIGTTRKPEKSEALKNKGVTIRAANFDDTTNLTEAFRGADRVLLVSTNKIGQRVQQHKNAIDAAKAAGVKHIAYTSIQGANKFTSLVTSEHLETENYLKQSGVNYTILRNNLYMESLQMKVKTGLPWNGFMGCASTSKIAYVSREDCARAATAALLSDFKNLTIDITGPQALSYTDVSEIGGKFVGKTLTYTDLAVEDYKTKLKGFGMPDVFAQLIIDFDLMAKAGTLEKTNSAVTELTGTAPETFESFLTKNGLT